jgi:hypothetical protein
LDFIRANQRVVTTGPSFRDLAKHLGVACNAAQRHVEALRAEGFVAANTGNGIVLKSSAVEHCLESVAARDSSFSRFTDRKPILLLALLALAPLAPAQTPVSTLLYVQNDVVTLPDSENYALLSSGNIYGSKTLAVSALAPGQAFRLHAAGTISTGAAPQRVMQYLDLSEAFGIQQLHASPPAIPGGLSSVRFALDVTVTLVRTAPGRLLLAATSDCALTVDGVSYSIPFPGLAINPSVPVGGSFDVNWRWAWFTHDPSNSLTVTTLITEWLR